MLTFKALTLIANSFIAYWVGGDHPVLKTSDFAHNFVVPAEFDDPLLSNAIMPDISFGDANAPVKIVMYFSLDCHHCRVFEEEDLPQIIQQFVNTGTVHFTLRDFPLSEPAVKATKLAWCGGPDKYFALVKDLMTHQDDWYFSEDDQLLYEIAERNGIPRDQAEKCLSSEALENQILVKRLLAQETYNKLNYAPAFIVNDELIDDMLTPALVQTFVKEKA